MPTFVRKTHERIEEACSAGKMADGRDNGISTDFAGGVPVRGRDDVDRVLVVLRHKVPLGVFPGRRQVGFADLASEPGIHNPQRVWWMRRLATGGPVVMDSGLRSLRSRPRNDGAEQFVTQYL
jgi:hypothetical protein